MIEKPNTITFCEPITKDHRELMYLIRDTYNTAKIWRLEEFVVNNNPTWEYVDSLFDQIKKYPDHLHLIDSVVFEEEICAIQEQSSPDSLTICFYTSEEQKEITNYQFEPDFCFPLYSDSTIADDHSLWEAVGKLAKAEEYQMLLPL